MQKSPSEPITNQAIFLILGILLIAAGLRAPITALGPLLDPIRTDLGLNAGQAGLLGSLPLFLFAAISPFAGLAGKFGMERTLLAAVLLMGAGITTRSLGFSSTLFGGTLLLSMGIALANVLLPALIKRDFPQRATLFTTIYITWMTSIGAAGSGLAVPLAIALAPLLPPIFTGNSSGICWQGSLGIWLLIPLLTLFIWTPQLRKTRAKSHGRQATAPLKAPCRANVARVVLKSALTWQITIFMGAQSLCFYSLSTWLAAILGSSGYSAEESGWLLAQYQLVGLASGFIIPFLVSRAKDQRFIAAGCGLICTIGPLGLMFLPEYAASWLNLIGLGSGASFILSIAFISLRSSDYNQATILSVLVNGGGYAIAATGPMLFGWLHEQTQTWMAPILFTAAVGFFQTCTGWLAGRNKTI